MSEESAESVEQKLSPTDASNNVLSKLTRLIVSRRGGRLGADAIVAGVGASALIAGLPAAPVALVAGLAIAANHSWQLFER